MTIAASTLYDVLCDGCGGVVFADLDASYIRIGRRANVEASVYHSECAPPSPPRAPLVIFLPGGSMSMTVQGVRLSWSRVDPV